MDAKPKVEDYFLQVKKAAIKTGSYTLCTQYLIMSVKQRLANAVSRNLMLSHIACNQYLQCIPRLVNVIVYD